MCALGHTMKYYAPELNCYMEWGDVIERPTVTISTVVLVGKDLTTVKIKDTHLKNVRQVSKETIQYVEENDAKVKMIKQSVNVTVYPKFRTRFENGYFKSYDGLLMNGAGHFLVLDCLRIPLVQHWLVTLVHLGLDYGIPALMPASNLSFVQAIGYVKDKPVVKDGEIIIQSVLPISATFDHRIVDGFHVSKYLKGLKHYFANPHDLMFDTEKVRRNVKFFGGCMIKDNF